MLKKRDVTETRRPANMPPEEIRNLISKRAYEIYRRRGNTPGDPTSDWAKAEQQIKNELRLGK